MHYKHLLINIDTGFKTTFGVNVFFNVNSTIENGYFEKGFIYMSEDYNNSNLRISSNNAILRNITSLSNGAIINISFPSRVLYINFYDAIIENTRSEKYGGVIYTERQSGSESERMNFTFQNCKFSNNTAQLGI